MNYEELLESRHGAAMAKQHLPFGWMHKKLLDGKYVNVVDLRDDLRDSLVFTEALIAEADQIRKQSDKRQIRISTLTDSAGLYGVAVEGSYPPMLSCSPTSRLSWLRRISSPIPSRDCWRRRLPCTKRAFSRSATPPTMSSPGRADNEVMLLFHGSA